MNDAFDWSNIVELTESEIADLKDALIDAECTDEDVGKELPGTLHDLYDILQDPSL